MGKNDEGKKQEYVKPGEQPTFAKPKKVEYLKAGESSTYKNPKEEYLKPGLPGAAG